MIFKNSQRFKFVPSYTNKTILKTQNKSAVQPTHSNHFVTNTVLIQQDSLALSGGRFYLNFGYQPAWI